MSFAEKYNVARKKVQVSTSITSDQFIVARIHSLTKAYCIPKYIPCEVTTHEVAVIVLDHCIWGMNYTPYFTCPKSLWFSRASSKSWDRKWHGHGDVGMNPWLVGRLDSFGFMKFINLILWIQVGLFYCRFSKKKLNSPLRTIWRTILRTI